MTRSAWQAADSAVETVHDTMLEQFGNIATYNVITGCTLTYSGSDLTVTVASGSITHNGSTVSVAGGTVTLVANASNPRWTWIILDSSGTPGIVSGTAAATPSVPEVGDNVEIALVYVAAAATIASSQTSYSRRLILPTPSDTTTTSLSSNQTTTSTTLADISGLAASVSANTNYLFRSIVGYYSGATNDYKFGITIPASASIFALVRYINTSGSGVVGTITASGGSVSANGYGASTAGVLAIDGVIQVSGTAGNLQFQHALAAGAGTNTTLAKSRIELY